jgi:hypothetical protein
MGLVKTLWMPQFQNEENKVMAGIRKSTLPVLRVGREVTEPSVGITEGGQIRFNKLAAVAFGDSKAAMLYDFDESTRVLKIVGYQGKLPKGWTEEDLFKFPEGDSNKGVYISCAAALRQIGYDYKASGNQVMKDLKMDKDKRVITFTVPKGALTPLPKQTRAKRSDTKVNSGATAAAPAKAAEAEAGDLDLNI